MIRSSPSIGIGISTKNRWKDLAVTLTHLRNEGLDHLETIVIDDGSDSPAPPELQQNFPWVKFERFEKSEGNLFRRNRLGGLLSTEFYLSLDDDSFPVAGDLEAAANWLKEHPKVAVLAFRVILAEDPVPVNPEPLAPVIVKDFINCAVLLRRSLFLAMNGYETRLHFYHEEPEYSFRTFLAGYETYAYPSVVIRHIVTKAARSRASRARYFVRNVVLLDLWYYPHPKSVLRAFGHLPLLFLRLPKFRRYWWAMIQGWVEGFLCYLAWEKSKQRLTPRQLAEWDNRPAAVNICMGATTPL